MAINIGDIFAGAAALQNDPLQKVYKNARIYPYLKIAYEDLRQELELNNVAVTNFTSKVLYIAAQVRDIGGEDGPAFPEDLIEPLTLWERSAGTTDDFLMMDKRQFLPKTEVETAFLRVWSWQQQIIKLLGANNNIDVKIDYVGDPLPKLLTENPETLQLRVTNTVNFLKYRTGALLSEYVGENPTRAESLNANSGRALDTLLGISAKSEQAIYTRRRSFRSRARSNGNSRYY